MVNFPGKARYDVNDLRRVVEILRAPGGCPWDREQTHKSIRRDLLEETAELCEAIDENSTEHMREELGDVLLQVMLHSRMEEEQGVFSLDDVADGICRKLILRHPHVFGDTQVADSGEVLRNWEDIKRKEKAQDTTAQAMDAVCRTLPGLWRAEKVQKKAAKTGFDWNSMDEILAKIREETDELQQALDNADEENIREELGDLLFCVVNVARRASMDPEAALHQACDKYIRRFAYMENAAMADETALKDLTIDRMMEYYQKARINLEGKEPPEGFLFTR